MKVDVITKKPWSISKKMQNQFNKENLEATLSSFNQFCGKRYYFVDYQKEEIIVDSHFSPILCGHPKELMEKEGFRFYERIF